MFMKEPTTHEENQYDASKEKPMKKEESAFYSVMNQGHMFSMLGNLPADYKPFKVGDKVYFKGVGLFAGSGTEILTIKEIQWGRGGHMVFEGEKSGIVKKTYDSVFDGYNLIQVKK